jgi:hypothetical protein
VPAPPASSMTVTAGQPAQVKLPGARTREVKLDPGASTGTPVRKRARLEPARTGRRPSPARCRRSRGASCHTRPQTTCPLRARSAGQRRVLAVTPGQPGMPADLRTGRPTRCAYRPSKQRVARGAAWPWEPRWEPHGRITLGCPGPTRTTEGDKPEVTNPSERFRTPTLESTDLKARPGFASR